MVSSDDTKLRPAEEVRAEEAVQGEEGAIGEPVDLDGVVVTVSALTVSGDDGGPWLETEMRIENTTDEDIQWLDVGILCTGNDEGGGWQIESTLDLNAGIPAGTFDEGSVNLLLPGDGRFGEERPVCEPPARIVVSPLRSGVASGGKAVVAIPDNVVAELNGHDTSEPAPVSTEPVTSEPERNETTDPPIPEPIEPPAEQGDAKEPESIIITLDDLPTGWSPAPPEEEGDDSVASCFDTAFESADAVLGDEGSYPSAEASFSQSEFGPFLIAGVTTGVDEAEDVLGDLGDGFASCDGTVDADGTTWTVLPLSFPSLGDETFAVRLDAESDFFPLSLLLVYARVDETIVVSGNFSIGSGVDPVLLEEVTRIMVDRA